MYNNRWIYKVIYVERDKNFLERTRYQVLVGSQLELIYFIYSLTKSKISTPCINILFDKENVSRNIRELNDFSCVDYDSSINITRGIYITYPPLWKGEMSRSHLEKN